MKMLQNLMIEKTNDLSRLPKDVISSIKSNIRKGAEDLSQQWANALELVHRAYEIEGVERPDPSMDTAWKQYEEMLQYSVQQLATNRGMDDDWRMSSAMFHEAHNPSPTFRITMGDKTNTVMAESMKEVVKLLKEQDEYDLNVTERSENSVVLSFSKYGIRKNARVKIEQII